MEKHKLNLAYVAHGGIAALGWWGWWGFGGYAGVIDEINSVWRKARMFPNFKYHFELDGYTFEFLKEMGNPITNRGLDKLKELAQENRVELVGGTYACPFVAYTDSESLIRHFQYGLEAIWKAIGVKIKTFYSQEPGFTLQSPFILKDFGFENAIFRFEYNGSLPKYNKEKLAWKGLDGTIISVVPTYEFNDGTFCYRNEENIIDKYLKDGVFGRFGSPDQYLSFAKKNEISNPLLLFSLDVTHGYFSDEEIKLVSEDAHFEFVLLKDYLTSINEKVHGDLIDISADDILVNPTFGWLGGKIKHKGRQISRNLYSAEVIDLIASILQPEEKLGRFKKIWKKTLISDNHDIQFFNHGYGYLSQSLTHEEGLKILSNAEKECSEILDELLSSITDEIDTSDLPGDAFLVIFNTLAWKRKETAKFIFECPPGTKTITVLHDNKVIPVQIEGLRFYKDGSVRRAKIKFLAELDGIGYKTYGIITNSNKLPKRMKNSIRAFEDSEYLTIENRFYRITFDKQMACIKFIFDKQTKKGYEGPFNEFSAYLSELDLWAKCRNVEIKIFEKDAIDVVIRIKCALIGESNKNAHVGDREVFKMSFPEETSEDIRTYLKIPFVSDVHLNDFCKRIDFVTTFNFPLGTQIGKLEKLKLEDLINMDRLMNNAKYSLRVNFATDDLNRIVTDIPFGFAERKTKVFAGLTWCRVEGGHKAYTLVNHGDIGYINDEKSIGNILAQAHCGVPGSSDTDRAYIYGRHIYKYSFIPDDMNLSTTKVMKKALEANTPLLLSLTSKHKGTLSPQKQYINCYGNVIPTAIRRDKDRALELRLYESEGRGEVASVKLDKQLTGEVKEVNLKGDKKQILGRIESELKLRFNPFQIRTIKIMK